MRFAAALALVLLSTTGVRAQVTAAAVVAGPQKAAQQADYRITGHMVRVDAGGKRTSTDITIKARWFAGVLRILVQVTAPADARSNVLIEMHPDGSNSVHTAHPGDKAAMLMPFDQWTNGPAGAGFSYEDLFEDQYFWPSQTVTKSEKRGARDCDVLKSTPGAADKTHYEQALTWLDHTIDFPVYTEKTLKGSGTVKEFTAFDVRHDEGVWSATQIEEKTRGQGGSTLLIINRGSAKANLTAADFSLDRLTHF